MSAISTKTAYRIVKIDLGTGEETFYDKLYKNKNVARLFCYKANRKDEEYEYKVVDVVLNSYLVS